jgi:hypothetical protein
MASLTERWKKEKEERNKSMLKRIFESDFAKEWTKTRQENLKEEIEFYGRERTEQEWQSDLLSEFFEQDLKDIVKVLPEIWGSIKEHVQSAVYDVLEKAETFEEHVHSGTFAEYVIVPFKLSKYLENVEDELQKVLKQHS